LLLAILDNTPSAFHNAGEAKWRKIERIKRRRKVHSISLTEDHGFHRRSVIDAATMAIVAASP
jgi:hypothetical protein